jgi:hypothetical protein
MEIILLGMNNFFILCTERITPSANSIGITRVCGDTTALLPKSLPKPSFGVTYLLAPMVR